MNDVNNRWMQNILTNRHKDIPILFRRNLNRQIADKQANRKEERGGMGVDSLQRKGALGWPYGGGGTVPPVLLPVTLLVLHGLRCAVLAPAFGACIPWYT